MSGRLRYSLPALALVLAFLSLSAAAPVGGLAVGPSADRGSGVVPQATARTDEPRIVSVYPNPVLEDDAGEFAVLWFPPGTDLTGWTLTDGESVLALGDREISGSVAVTTDPEAASNTTTYPVLALDGSLSLANGGDELTLSYRNETVDEMRYENAPDAELFVRNETGGWAWEPLGATAFDPMNSGPSTVRTFVLPDDSSAALDAIRGADERILIGGYSFESERVARELKRAVARGVEVRVLLDDAPVGGISTTEARVLDSLSRSGVAVEVTGGPYGRYDFHHPKYAVIDDRALVATENWKPSGLGGQSSRGWGVVVDDRETAADLAAIFHADADWRDTTSWSDFRRGRTFTAEEPTNGSFPTEFEPRSVRADNVTVLAAPDNAEHEIVSALDGADESVSVIQVSIGSRDQPFLAAALRAARRGVNVKILLSSAWYTREDNEALATWLRGVSRAEDLPLDAKVADPGNRYEKIHAKGVIVDRETVLLGSLNWNNNSARENREIDLRLDGSEVGAYYGRVFDADWEGGDGDGGGEAIGTDLPIGLIAAVFGILVLAALVARRIRFAD